jgi:hypothetical protein
MVKLTAWSNSKSLESVIRKHAAQSNRKERAMRPIRPCRPWLLSCNLRMVEFLNLPAWFLKFIRFCRRILASGFFLVCLCNFSNRKFVTCTVPFLNPNLWIVVGDTCYFLNGASHSCLSRSMFDCSAPETDCQLCKPSISLEPAPRMELMSCGSQLPASRTDRRFDKKGKRLCITYVHL